ncbi:hypothetical protein LEP48_02660 [Isoptericola sp. NEAU-Y5]|uniref:Integral membrane protein n=1 Tax=Isoptericola luteus TaxID=2879484 RepID=A0ABS7ZDA7_9MICO|nr:hypothetical protein [Isoptericola sp. NEAU-Y5]MCA5892251.1 hypothetical protein [Isoptericola sp. NEAU-Y5]
MIRATARTTARATARAAGGGQARTASGHGGESRTTAALGLFAEVALAGVLVAVGSVLLVTAVPSLAAGVAHVRRQVSGHDVGLGRFARDWWAAVRSLWTLGLAAVGVALLLVLDWQLASSGVLPGADVVAVVVALAAAVVVVVLARAAGVWAEGAAPATGSRGDVTVRRALAAGARRAQDDLGGSALLVAAVGLCAVFVWMLPPLALLAGGLLAMAVVGVEARGVTDRPAA